ncbi:MULTISPECIES: hypothetical protein [Streptomyces]|jgi:hypothetical protein|uniref:hypothetical protein n=1 Tax=Streptomyces TaxID=1883 RepID=UPI000D3AFCF4|nr:MULTISPECIES: hypothetical protein [Streptomyces]MBY8345515.1 hypothetical protein [Streptomyces plumbidurans]PTM99547.1 hypothetical protein C7821_102495 [Streptomyces sp. VMFN-G11Ma]
MARFEVYISDEGFAEIEGEPLVPAPGQSVHEVVLDQLQRYAVENGGAVEATVTERPDTGHFVLEVAPDGSSRLLAPKDASPHDQEDEPAPESTALEPGPEPALEPEPGPGPGRAPAPGRGSAVNAVTAAVARAAAAARAATPVPAELAVQIGHINALARADRLDEAYEAASRLRERLAGEAGADHPNAVEARAVEAYVAHLCGDHREAVVLALAVARIRCRAGDRRAPEDVARAVAAWQWLDEERAIEVHGHELLHMWEQLDRRGLLSPDHTRLARQVRRRMAEPEVFV